MDTEEDANGAGGFLRASTQTRCALCAYVTLVVAGGFETRRILFCINRNRSHQLLYVFASSSVKTRDLPFQSHRLLKFASAGRNGTKCNGGRSPYLTEGVF